MKVMKAFRIKSSISAIQEISVNFSFIRKASAYFNQINVYKFLKHTKWQMFHQLTCKNAHVDSLFGYRASSN